MEEYFLTNTKLHLVMRLCSSDNCCNRFIPPQPSEGSAKADIARVRKELFLFNIYDWRPIHGSFKGRDGVLERTTLYEAYSIVWNLHAKARN